MLMIHLEKENNLKAKEKEVVEEIQDLEVPSNEEIDKLKTDIVNLNEKLMRVMADSQNIKRRTDEEMSKMRKYEGEDLIIKLLDISDDFERALLVNEVSTEMKKFLDGFEMIFASLKGILSNKNVVEINCLNEEFNPEIAEAILTEKVDGVESGIVIDVLQKGYRYNEKVIRPAMVKVSE